MRALVREYETYAPAGLVGERLDALGFDVVATRPAEGVAPAVRDFDVVVPLGSVSSVRDAPRTPWIRDEVTLLRRAIEADVPVLGVCFGGQLLATALGGQVVRAPFPEIGVLPIETSAPEVVPAGPWVQWHFDVIELPPGTEELARSAAGPQAFTAGPHLGLQFHPEVDEKIMAVWLEVAGDQLRELGVDAEALQAQTAAHAERARHGTARLVDAFVRRAGLG